LLLHIGPVGWLIGRKHHRLPLLQLLLPLLLLLELLLLELLLLLLLLEFHEKLLRGFDRGLSILLLLPIWRQALWRPLLFYSLFRLVCVLVAGGFSSIIALHLFWRRIWLWLSFSLALGTGRDWESDGMAPRIHHRIGLVGAGGRSSSSGGRASGLGGKDYLLHRSRVSCRAYHDVVKVGPIQQAGENLARRTRAQTSDYALIGVGWNVHRSACLGADSAQNVTQCRILRLNRKLTSLIGYLRRNGRHLIEGRLRQRALRNDRLRRRCLFLLARCWVLRGLRQSPEEEGQEC